jgi:hypothetical protein
MDYKALEIFLTGAISTLGAFVPIFLVMCGHFIFRKYAYNKNKQSLVKLNKCQNTITKISEDALENIYQSVGAENFEGLLNHSGLEKMQHLKLITLANEHLNHIIEGRNKSIKILLDISYIESYNFKTYIGTLLDKRFPDKHFN